MNISAHQEDESMLDRNENKYETKAREKFKAIKQKFKISHDIQHEAALNSVKVRLFSIVNRSHAIELFDNEVLTFNDLDSATSLDEVTKIIDEYLAITDFYENNYKVFYSLIRDNHIKNMLRSDGLCYWEELLEKTINYKTLNHDQSTAYVNYVLNHAECDLHHHNTTIQANTNSQAHVIPSATNDLHSKNGVDEKQKELSADKSEMLRVYQHRM